MIFRLRALLIQKDVKQIHRSDNFQRSLRALLIQKDVKQFLQLISLVSGLRALLIQKDVKLSVESNAYAMV